MTTARPSQSSRNMPNLTGKRVLLTGAEAGIGLEAAIQFASRGGEVVICCKNPDQAVSSRDVILSRSRCDAHKIKFVQTDLANVESVKSFRAHYDSVVGHGAKIDILVLNPASEYDYSAKQTTPEGMEELMAATAVGNYLLISEVMDLLRTGEGGRIVFVSAAGYGVAERLHDYMFELQQPRGTTTTGTQHPAPRKTRAEARLAMVLLMNKLIRVMRARGVDNVVVVAANPGRAPDLRPHSSAFLQGLAAATAPQTVSKGAQAEVLAATDPRARTGDYAAPWFADRWGKPTWGSKLSPGSFDEEQQDKLWARCVQLSGVDLSSKMGGETTSSETQQRRQPSPELVETEMRTTTTTISPPVMPPPPLERETAIAGPDRAVT